ncbi:hypothetical protein [Lactococcus formosensis]|jgi:hypothetical protein|uniref:Uncharacterized protein n=1 Tax=Lactococcus formosensis TaxID=1281486 RepID=A0A9Q8Y4W6_9LACT|nr:hypothetical protein [Lactococcus formosensis]USJ21447.1 hypothetical protein LMK00_05475 [Lactococcus formosensis]
MDAKGNKWNNSSIITNVGDKLGVLIPENPESTDNLFNYIAPLAPEGYDIATKNTQSVTVHNYPLGEKILIKL